MQHNSTKIPLEAKPLSLDIEAVVLVSTASAIVRSSEDPYRILVATSTKHKMPVIPGGKVERYENDGDAARSGLSCVLREVKEEIGVELQNPRLIGKAVDPYRDIRLVPASKLSTTCVQPELPADLAPDAMVKAHYGCPDYIYMGEVNESQVVETEELKDLHFVDVREIGADDLSAGHDVIVQWYRQMLDKGEIHLPAGALRRFDDERAAFIADEDRT